MEVYPERQKRQKTRFVCNFNGKSVFRCTQRAITQRRAITLGPIYIKMVLNRAQGLKKKSEEVSARKNNNRQRYNKKCRRGWIPPPGSLRFNDNKTEVMHVTSRFTNKLNLGNINVGGSSCFSVILGSRPWSCLRRHAYYDQPCQYYLRNASFTIRKIGKLRRYLDQDSTEKLVHAFVTSRLDSCNAILYRLPDKELSKLQRIQNAAARVVTLSRKHDHITPVMRDLHWLPVRQRIIFKLMLLTFRSLCGSAPSYISELTTRYQPTRSLRSASQCLLKELSMHTSTYGDRRFAVCAPRLWNCLPLHVRNSATINHFKCRLKTYLFSQTYD